MSPPGVRALTLPEVPVTRFEEIVCCATQTTSSRKSWCFKTILLKGLRTSYPMPSWRPWPSPVPRARSLPAALYKRRAGGASVVVGWRSPPKPEDTARR